MSRSSEGLAYDAPPSPKITDAHLDRMAEVYVRQSTTQQVLNHQESTRLQYGLRDDARRMGWPDDRERSGKSARISSCDIPEAGYSRMSWTVIPVPQTVGLPRTVGAMRLHSKYLIPVEYGSR